MIATAANPNLAQDTKARYLPCLLLLFVGSGCAALIYEVVWLQLLQLVIGSSGISVGVLLGTFMGGMCLGSFALPRLISHQRHPLRVYALLELGIGGFGFLAPLAMPLIADLYSNHLGHGILVRSLIATVCLLPPALLMGATLPALARWLEDTPEGISWMGFFYGGNIAGAVLGCLLAGFFLLRIYDMMTASYVAVAINVAVAAMAFTLTSRAPYQTAFRGRSADARSGPNAGSVHITIAVSGFCALGAEVVWTRLLSLMFGATVYTFSIILAVFLAGLGIGSSAGASLARKPARSRTALGVCQLLIAAAAAWAAFIIAKSLPYWPINPSLSVGKWGPWDMFQLDLLRAAWAVLPAAVLWGASFPLAVAAVSSPGRDPGRVVGGIYAANTLGAVAGSLLFSMLIVPQIGTQWAERLLILMSASAAIVALAPLYVPARHGVQNEAEPQPRPALAPLGVAAALVALLVLGFLIKTVAQVPWMTVAWGRFSATYMAQSVPGIVADKDVPLEPGGGDQRYCTYVGEGMNVSVAVTKSTTGARYFHGAGKVQASSDPLDMRLQRMLGHLSVLGRSKPEEATDVLVVACGAGVTAGSFVPYPNIKRIVICDIEPLVPKVVTPMFGNENYHIVDGIDRQNPHVVNGKEVQVVYDDGRHYIRTLPKEVKYDVITSDPIDPWVKGSAALNTIEYYEMCKEHLKPGGVMSLWIPLYESDSETAKSVIGTFFQVFPNGILFSNDTGVGAYDAILFGKAEPTRIDVDQLEHKLLSDDYGQVRRSLLEAGFGRDEPEADEGFNKRDVVMELLATYAGRAADLKEWMQGAEINTDRNLRLQYLAGLSFNTYDATAILNAILQYYRFPQDVFVGTPQTLERLKQALASYGRHPRR